jgi:hypothetical protein
VIHSALNICTFTSPKMFFKYMCLKQISNSVLGECYPNEQLGAVSSYRQVRLFLATCPEICCSFGCCPFPLYLPLNWVFWACLPSVFPKSCLFFRPWKRPWVLEGNNTKPQLSPFPFASHFTMVHRF